MSKSTMLAFKQMLLQVKKDAMLVMVCLAPILAGLFVRFGIPQAENLLCKVLEKDMFLAPYYIIFDFLLFMVTPVMFAFVGALVMLGEIDDTTAAYMSVTPVGKSGYVVARLIYPMVLSFTVTIMLVSSCHLTNITFSTIVLGSIFQVLLSLCISFMIVALSSNKVEGMAVGKVSSVTMLGMFVPFFIKGKIQYVASILPSFWFGKYMESRSYLMLGIGFLLVVVWIWILQRRYMRKI